MKNKKFCRIILKIISFFVLLGLYFSTQTAVAGTDLVVPVTNLPEAPGGIRAILANLLAWILSIFGVIAIISFAVSGIQYFMAAGDEKRMDTAKKNMTYSIIGVIVALSAFVIIQAVDYALRGFSLF